MYSVMSYTLPLMIIHKDSRVQCSPTSSVVKTLFLFEISLMLEGLNFGVGLAVVVRVSGVGLSIQGCGEGEGDAWDGGILYSILLLDVLSMCEGGGALVLCADVLISVLFRMLPSSSTIATKMGVMDELVSLLNVLCVPSQYGKERDC